MDDLTKEIRRIASYLREDNHEAISQINRSAENHAKMLAAKEDAILRGKEDLGISFTFNKDFERFVDFKKHQEDVARHWFRNKPLESLAHANVTNILTEAELRTIAESFKPELKEAVLNKLSDMSI